MQSWSPSRKHVCSVWMIHFGFCRFLCVRIFTDFYTRDHKAWTQFEFLPIKQNKFARLTVLTRSGSKWIHTTDILQQKKLQEQRDWCKHYFQVKYFFLAEPNSFISQHVLMKTSVHSLKDQILTQKAAEAHFHYTLGFVCLFLQKGTVVTQCFDKALSRW